MRVQIIAIVVAIILAFLAVLVLIGVLPGLRERGASGEKLTMWGFEKENIANKIVLELGSSQNSADVKYIVKNLGAWESELLNVLARGGVDAPDILVFPSDYLKKHADKLSPAPSQLITEREIKQQFIEAADAFLGKNNEILGMPFYADALVLYWNKDIFTQNLITLPPKTWDEFLEISSKITKKDPSGAILVSGAALGRGINIENAPLILSTLFLQSGDKIIKGSEVTLGETAGVGMADLRPAESVLRFTSDFSNPRKTVQSWSPALQEAREVFASNRLGMYIGLISEYNEIKNKNPHLNFAVADLPQLKDALRPVTGGTLYALAVPKASLKQRASWEFIKFLTSREPSSFYADEIGSVSLRRDMLPKYQKESVRSVFAEAALALKLWPVPDPKAAKQIFKEMIEEVALERATLREAIEKAKARLSAIN